MSKISFEEFEQLLKYDAAGECSCTEVFFHIDDDLEYTSCWLGKMSGKNADEPVYWYGLSQDGSQAYDFNSLNDFINAPVFHGETIKNKWNFVTLSSIDGCSVTERLRHYLRG